MPFTSSRLIASAFIVGLIAMPGAALAQTATPPATEQQGEAIEPTEDQLESFASATIDIVRIQENAQRLMQTAVEQSGLTIEEYNQIAQAAQTDPEIDQALQALIQERIAEQPEEGSGG